MDKDYYRILGVLDDAEDIVIRAAYKALAQRYHPDKWVGSKDEANRRMSDINEAFSTLSDPVKRKNYDESRNSGNFGNDAEAETVAKESSDFLDEVNKDWKIAKNHYPEIENNYKLLEKFSYLLAFSFKVALLDTKKFNDNQSFYLKLKKEFFSRHFGSSYLINQFAEELLLENQREAAKELNEHVRILGESIIEDKVISEISYKYKTKRYIAIEKNKQERELIRERIKRNEEAEQQHQNELRKKLEKERIEKEKQDLENIKHIDKIFIKGVILFIIFFVTAGLVYKVGTFDALKFLIMAGLFIGGYYIFKRDRQIENQEVLKIKKNIISPKVKNYLYFGLVISFVIAVFTASCLYFGLFTTFSILIVLGGLLGGYYLFKNSQKLNISKIITCPRCKEKFKVPTGKHIEITCKKCSYIWKIHS